MYCHTRNIVFGFVILATVNGFENDLNCSANTECFIETEFGFIQGERMQTFFENETFCAYRGIPYAKPPIGDLRFKSPVPHDEYFNGTFQAINYGAACYRQSYLSYYTESDWKYDEDCLFINIFVPNERVCDCRKIPVAFYIYGGGFSEGMSNDFQLGPNTLMENCLIFVTFNYRLGAFGFLSLGRREYSGNMGMKDQQMALRWMNKNINAFGGDPDNVMIFGNSAGATSVSHQSLNEMSRTLFKRGYAMSGTAMAIHAFSDNNNHTDRVTNCAAELGIPIDNDLDLLNFLETVSAIDIVRYMSQPYPYRITLIPYWQPVAEVEDAVNPFLVKHPEDVYKDGNINVSMIYSFTTLENIMFSMDEIHNPKLIEHLNDDFEFPLPIVGLNQEICKDKLRPIFEQIRRFYFGNQRIDGRTIANYVRMFSDVNWSTSIYKAATLHATYSDGDVRLLNFNAKTALNHFQHDLEVEALPGISHTEDLNYFVYWREREPIYQFIKETKDFYGPSMQAYKTIKTMHELITSFASTGIPTSTTAELDDFPAVNRESLDRVPFVEITNSGDPTIGFNPNREAFELWNRINEQIDELKRHGCNDKANGYSNV